MSNVLSWPEDLTSSSDQPACIPPGTYELEHMQYYTGIIHGGPKVALWFRVVTMGEYFHTQRYYHVNSIGKNGTFKAGWHSDLVRECVRVLGERPNRRDRIPITRYRGRYILGRVYTV